jgi:large subunit ribosomal protein L21
MYAVIRTGGKQYRVSAGDQLRVEKLGDPVGAQIELAEVLMLAQGDAVSVGKPVIAGAAVRATVLAHGRGDKVTIFKMRRRKNYRRHQGHRQDYTELRIDAIGTV